jgi:uncharacterized protein YciI
MAVVTVATDATLKLRYTPMEARNNRASFKESPMKYYLCKFLPPRADFLATMTPDEVDLMKRHGAFLNDLLDKGVVVAHGPVDDPAGGWGLSLYQVGDDVDVKALASQDPMVSAGGARYEVLPMRHLRSRG